MSKTLGQIAHEAGEKAGGWARKWNDMGPAQREEWEEIARAVLEEYWRCLSKPRDLDDGDTA